MPSVTEKNQERQLVTRPPIVVVLGHIDHGKTTLLDAIRKTRVAEREAGGITQAIGAYQVSVEDRKITFIDTPGHEAFSKMRSRGAHVADVAVLVVAADEGVKPQTEEAIGIAKDAATPLVVAINKIDKPNADSERVKRELAQAGLLLEGLGGQVPAVETSAKTAQGIQELMETILLVAELEEFKTDPVKPASGVVIESHLDPRRGATATLLLTEGRMRRGDVVVIGDQIAPVKIFENFLGAAVEEAGASEPVRIVGFDRVSPLGERFQAFRSRQEAEAHVEAHPSALAPRTPMTAGVAAEGQAVVNLVLKADRLGSLEALEATISGMETPSLGFRILKREVGAIAESDVALAAAGEPSLVIGFRVKISPALAELAERRRVRMVMGDVIYEVLDALKQAIREVLPPQTLRRDIGRATVLALFRSPNGKQIFGGRVESGSVRSGARFDIQRNSLTVGSGKIVELQSNRRPVPEVAEGQEFGILAEADLTIAVGDALLVFQEEQVTPVL